MTASPLIIPVARFFTVSGGAALAGGQVYTYAAGTNTLKASYTDFGGLTPNANPVILDSSGQAGIWLNGNYKINVLDSTGVQQPNYPVDNVSSFSVGSASEYAVTTGSANTYVLTPAPAITAYTTGITFKIQINATNTGPSTINVSALGAINLVKLGSVALTGGELMSGNIYIVVYDGTNFQIIGTSTYGFKNADIASAATVNLATVSGAYVHITGTVTIASFGTINAGQFRFLEFDSALVLTYNATSMILPTSANITTAAGDTALFISEGSGNWRCLNYTRATGQPMGVVTIAQGGTGQSTAATAFGALKQAATTAATGVVQLAANSDVTTGTSTSLVSPVSSMVYHKGIAKAWAKFDLTGAIGDSYGITSVTDNSTALKTINFNFTWANTNYTASCLQIQSSPSSYTPNMTLGTQTTGACPLNNVDETTNVTGWTMIFMGQI